MGLGDMAKKAKDALSSDKGEEVSDRALDRGAGLANTATGGKHADKVQRGRDAVDERVGTPSGGDDATSGVNAAGTAGGADKGTGNTTAGADQPGPDETTGTGRHRA